MCSFVPGLGRHDGRDEAVPQAVDLPAGGVEVGLQLHLAVAEALNLVLAGDILPQQLQLL